MASGSGQSVRLPRPAPKVNSVSSAKCGSDRSLAALISARSLGAASMAESCLNLASAALSSMTGKSAGASSAPGSASSDCCRHERVLKTAPAFGIAFRQRRAQRPLVDLGGEQQLIGGRGDGQQYAARVAAHDAAPIRPTQFSRRRAEPARARRRSLPHRAGARTTSSTAPVDAKNRLLPVKRLESSNGNSRRTFSRRSPAPSAHRARRGSGRPC